MSTRTIMTSQVETNPSAFALCGLQLAALHPFRRALCPCFWRQTLTRMLRRRQIGRQVLEQSARAEVGER